MPSSLIQKKEEAIAIIGSACRFPGNTDTPSKLWDLLQNPRDLCIPLPAARFNAAGFYHKNATHHGHSNVQDMKSYFLSEDPIERYFDASFFGINPAEANVLDPQIRLLLETTYEALEAGGQKMESLQGSDTGCYVGLMIGEYEQFMMRDPESAGMYHVMGTARSLMSNRLSYFFDWHGPSMTIDTACSSSLVAVHQAVQLLRSGQSRVAIAAGSNLILDPMTHVSESNLQMLSPDGRGRMWDAGANGYARGEGVGAIVMKKLSDAMADGDHIECIIRETGINQDGKTRGITLPSASAQAALIRDTYRRAGLDPKLPSDRPHFFEAHGTGTPAGDPVEAEAIHSAFFGSPTQKAEHSSDSLFVGSIKTVCGHTEGTAGIAAVLKASLALQQSVVPPNLLFSRLNPKIEPFSARLHVPTSPVAWPSTEAGQPRRASVNSFGFGGTNAHVILESCTSVATDAMDTMHESRNHVPVVTPFVFSAASEKSLTNYLGSFSAYVEANKETIDLRDVAYTLHTRRSRLPYATAVAASDINGLRSRLQEKFQAASSGTPVGIRARLGRDQDEGKRGPVILGVFTGQGAQWPRMGAELLSSSVAAAEIISALEKRLARLPLADRPVWSLREEMERVVDSRVGEAELSQPLCTAIQIVLVDLFHSAGITFSAVVGHSSGEIAAAYAAGIISADDAICIAHYRGLHGKLAGGSDGQKGAMMAAGISVEDASELIESEVFEGRAAIAAYNSSSSLTLSGDEDAIEELKTILEDEEKFARLLKVEKAYHSHHMVPCAGPYFNSLKALDIQLSTPNCTWISSVSGDDIIDHGLEKLKDQYWVENAVSPVLFMQAVQKTCTHLGPSEFDLAFELGPHPGLQGPAMQTIQETIGQTIPYTGLLKRGASDIVSVAEGLGFAWTHLSRGALDLQAFDQLMSEKAPSRLVKSLPTYSWDHDVEYWHESRYTKSSLSRTKAHELLGHLASDITIDQELRWRQILTPTEIPWLNGHRLQDQTVFPAAGYVVLAIESCRELLRLSPDLGSATLIQVHNISIHQAMTFDSDDSRVEAVFALNDITREVGTISAKFKYSAASSGTNQKARSDSSLRMLASGCVQISLGKQSPRALPARGSRPDSLLPVKADDFYESLKQIEYDYSGPFRALSGLERKLGVVTGWVSTPKDDPDSELLVHPGMLDAAFQAVLLAKAAPYDGSLWSMHVPKTIDRVTLNPFLCETRNIRGMKLPFDSYQRSVLTSSFKGDVDVYSPHSDPNSHSGSEELAHAMIQVEGLDCVPFSPASAQDDKEIMSVMVWDSAFPDAEKAAYDMSPTPDPRELELARLLERVSFYFLKNLQRSIPEDDSSRRAGQPLSRLFSFARHVETRIASGQLPFWKKEWYEDTWETISAASKLFVDVIDYRLLTRIGENLVDIVLGNTSAIEVTMKDEILNEFYPIALGMAHHTKYLARTVKQITYRFPHLNILELGAGTGGATKAVLEAVGDSFSSYTFTDISSGFFPKAQEYFNNVLSSSRITYKVLDISKDPLKQGFTAQAYDLIIASQVLHATPVMRQSLQNARRLLKPGGYLVVNEGVNNDTARLGTIFGAFPGWWLGAKDDGRFLGPNLAVAEWNELLRDTGFSGCDSLVPIVDPLWTPNTVFVSQAVDARVSFLRNPLSIPAQALDSNVAPGTAVAPVMRALILVGGSSLTTSKLISQLKLLLQDYFSSVTLVSALADLVHLNMPLSPETTILSLSDVDEPFFRNITDADFESMKTILHSAGSVFWVTQGRRAENPFANMTVGMVRSALLEIPTLSFQFLDFEDAGALDATIIAEGLLRFKAGVTWAPRRENQDSTPSILMTVERELVLDKYGQMLIPRIIPNQDMNDRYNSARRPIYRKVGIVGQESDHKNKIGVVMRLDKERGEYCVEEVEQQATSDTLQVTHSLLLTRQIKSLGHAYISLGRNNKSTIQVMLSGQISSTIRPLENLPPVPVSKGRLLLKNSESKARFLSLVALNILAIDMISDLSQGDHLVVYEPEPAFATILKREARHRQVDVTIVTSIMSSQRCDFLGWLLIHPQAPARVIQGLLPKNASVFLICDGGHQMDPTSTAGRIISHLPSQCRVVSIADSFGKEAHIEATNARIAGPDLHNRLLAAVKHAQGDMTSINEDIRTVPISHISEATTTFDPNLDEKAQRSVIVEWEGICDAFVKIRPIDDQKLFSDSKTFWLAGLTGSLGLSLCEWMIGRGAKYIVMTSRRPNVSPSWLERMASLGGIVKVHSTDLTDMNQTESFHRDICSAMPPIGGVASGAMVLMDTTLRNMNLDAMKQVCRPKVQGTIHLDKMFQNSDLEFFIVFSSLTAVTGNPGQANYSAANMFMTSIAEQRRRRGLAASVIHIAPILGVGYVSEKSDRTKTNFPRTSGYSLTAEQDFRQLFAEAVVTGRARSASGNLSGHLEVAMGLHKVSSNPEKLPYWFDNPTATHFIRNGDTTDISKTSVTKASVKALLVPAKTRDQVEQILIDAIKPFICSLFQLQGGADLDDSNFMDLYLDNIGLDSLLAVEIRTWWLKTVNVNLPVMKILSGLSIGQLISTGVETLSPALIPNVIAEAGGDTAQPQIPHSQESKLPNGTNGHDSPTTDASYVSCSTSSFEIMYTPDTDTSIIAPKSSSNTSNEDNHLQVPQPVVERWMELSFGQTMFWFVLTFLADKAGLNHTGLFRLTGPLRIPDLERAVVGLGQRHESLRTCFRTIDGQPKQGIMETSQLCLERRRISKDIEATVVADELQNYCYDFERGECLRVILLELSPTTHFLLFGTHSLVLDGVSSAVLTRELLQLYENDASITDSSAICQYPAFALAQLEAFKAGELEQGLRFWRKELASCPPPMPVLRISSAISRPVQSRYENHRIDMRIDSATKSLIWDICRRCKIRPFHFFLTAFRALLSRVADVEEVCIGIVDANRSHEGALGSLGPYINLLPLRFSNNVLQRFEAALQETKNKANTALAHSHVPFQVLLNDLGVSRSATHAPIFQTFFDYRQGMRKKQSWGDCELELLSFQASKLPYDVSLDIIDDAGNGDCHLMLIVREDMYSKQDAECLLKSYEKLVKSFVSTPNITFMEPDMFETQDIERALQFGRKEAVPSQWPYESIVGRIYAIARSNPNEVALKLPYGGESMTYREMIDKSQAIAAALRSEGCTAGSVVAVYQEPTPNWLSSVLGVFSAGAVCVPFDASTIVKRLADMTEDSKASFILVDDDTEEQAIKTLSAHDTRNIINVEQVVPKKGQISVPLSLPNAEDPAMILYTSGSTGVPKGIVLKHGGFKNWGEFVPPLYKSWERDTVLQQSSSGFDMAYLQSFFALCYGGTVCIVPRGMRVDAGAITDIIDNEGVTVTCGVPSEYSNWLRYGSPEALARSKRWKTAMCGGEPGSNTVLELQAALGPQPRPRFIHMYGPTEITFIATGMELFYGSGEKSPAVGGPFPNYSVYVLDDQLRPVPPGFQGEIYISGAGVASGYLGNAALTAEKFLPDPRAPASFKSNGWAAIHRTGDKGRWREDGGLLIEGRSSGDTQHKLRGLRIDLQEVESVMLKESNGMLSDAVVSVLRTSPQSPEFLVAHVRFDPKHSPPEAEKQHLLSQLSSSLPLPQYMWPAATIAVKELPMMSSGKLDRRAVAALPLPELSNLSDVWNDNPGSLTETEVQLKKMWEVLISKSVTKLHRIRADTDFFQVGGTSMLLLRLQAHIRESFGFTIPFVDMFESSTLGSMARRIDNNKRESELETFDWDLETEIPEATISALKEAIDSRPAPPKVVVLTGATGLLGQGFLQALIADPSIKKIHCIAVRNASARGSSLPLLGNRKVVLHEGDLTLPYLGLDEVKVRTIFGEADRVIHNGADTSHLKTYQSLRKVNLQATKEIVDMCLLVGKKTPVHYVSTASVLQYSGLDEFGEESASRYPPPPDAFDGYSASKWASERYLEKIHERSSGGKWPIWIHRPTSVQNGGSPPDDINLEVIRNLLKYCKVTNAVPLSQNLRGVMNLVPLECVVESMLREIYVTMEGTKVRYLHESGDIDIPMANIKSFIDAETGDDAVVLPLDEWAKLAAQFGLDPVLVAFFENVVNMPPVTWQRLVKNKSC
ncbi:AMP-binding enzyme [Melanomma pulvis-pyrius CBS 109.77]|uniref:AMP-binding enzyme n=1 Tax=Melanomma pulvis-pyrius CBS 109.77 TaxID=1314802 RepID=A0A6A6XM52_9PLEO|nr:AMP-binding enzyme [Melanomma pulvis-pyrius CBS 109.77]